MRISTALLSIVLAGCASANHPGDQTGPSSSAAARRGSVMVVSREEVDTPPRLVICNAVSNVGGGSGAYLTVPVRFTVTPEGLVAPGSAHAVGRVGFRWTRPSIEEETARRLLAQKETARGWAERNAATCTFEPAKRDGHPVAVDARWTFYYAD